MVNLNVDMSNQWYRQLRTARYFSRMLCAQRSNMEQFERYGARPLYFPMAASAPPTATAVGAWQPAAPVTFVGTPMPYRTRCLVHLHQAGVALAVYGRHWREQRQAEPGRHPEKLLQDLRHYAWPRLRAEGVSGLLHSLRSRLPRVSAPVHAGQLPQELLHGFVPETAMVSLFAGSRINLGFTRMIGDDPERPGTNQVKLRDFEVPMAGGFYLVEAAPDYPELFRPGVEVETWNNVRELVDKIRYYLEHESERRRIAAAGKQRAFAQHQWEKRFMDLFLELQIVKPLFQPDDVLAE